MQNPSPKAPAKIPHRLEIHNDVRIDDYFWMRERDSGPVLDYLKGENERTVAALADVAELEQELYREMRARIKEDDSSVPVFNEGYYYQTRYLKGREYPVHCRRQGSESAPEEVILDENALSEGHTYFDVGECEVSPNQRLLAYAVDTVGRRIYDIFFKDLTTGNLLPDRVTGVTANVVWAADNKTFFFVRQDPETLRPYQLFRQRLGGSGPELVYEEPDTTFNVGISATKRHNLLFMSIEKRDSCEWRWLDSSHPEGEWKVIWPREADHEYSVIDGGDRLFILTNWDAHNFRLMEAKLTDSDKDNWKEIIPTSPTVFLESVDVYKDFLVISERENGLTQVRLRDRATGKDRWLKFPDPAYEVSAFSLPDFASPVVRFRYESLVRPPSVYDENVGTAKRDLRKVREVPGFQAEKYVSERLWVQAADGTRVPISLLRLRSMKHDGQNPCLLYGYGSYGLTTDNFFRSHVLSLVDRGFVFALAHVRGGSEMGRDWYEFGRLKNKMNTFTDFIACAEKLIGEKYTTAAHLHMMGGSAGGLLMGAVMNLRPDLFKGVVAAVPFVDVLTTMLDESIPLTTGEYREWGDPRVRDEYLYMKQYSPYDNVEKKAYPNVLVTTGYHDSQVQYWEPAKWVARLRELKTDNNLLLLFTELEAGHSGASGRFEMLKTLAKEYAFVLKLEGVRS